MKIFLLILLFSINAFAAQKQVAGIIRYLNGSWVLLNESDSHGSINVSSVSTHTWDATINLNFTATKVYTFITSVDDAYAIRGYTAGASAGLSSVRIEFGQNGTVKQSSQMNVDGSAIFFYGLFED